MADTVLDISISIDGFVARPDDAAGPIHDWFFAGEDVIPGSPFLKTIGVNTDVVEETTRTSGAVLAGRRTYDFAGGWGGEHPMAGLPVFVVTHAAPPPGEVPEGPTAFTFATDGIGAAVAAARAAAGDKDVCVMGGASIVRACLAEGLLDVLQLHVTPVVLGRGVRLIDHLDAEVALEQDRVLEGPGVTHLRYRVVR